MTKQSIFCKNRLLTLIILALLVIVPLLINVAKASVICTDNFESGNFNNWTTVNSPAINTSPVHSGKYAATFQFGTEASYATKSISPTNTLNYTYYIYFTGFPSNFICVILAQSSATNNSIFYRIQNVGGLYVWQFNAGSNQVINTTTPNVQHSQWYKIQLLAMTGSNSTFYFLVNDQLKATITNQTTGPIDQLRIGNDWVDGYLGGGATIIDDVVATNSITPVISAFASDGGSISPSGTISVNYGGSQTFNITANQGYHITDVSVNGASEGPISTYTFNNAQGVNSISASFAINNYTIIASADANGAISPNGDLVLNYGSSQTFTITPKTNYHIADVTVNGTSVGPVKSYQLNNIQGSYTIFASFAPDPTLTPATPNTTVAPTPSSPTPTPSQNPAATATPTASPIIEHSATSPSDYAPIIIIAILIAALIGASLLYIKKNRSSVPEYD